MIDEKTITIFLVDDDPLFLKNLEIDFKEHTDFNVKLFPTGEKCIENLHMNPNVIILDYHLDGLDKNAMNGLQTLDKVKSANPQIPVVILSSQDKIEVAVNCMHHHAFDYIVKSETAFVRLRKTLSSIFKYQKIENALNWYKSKQ